MKIIHFEQVLKKKERRRGELTESAPLGRSAPSLNRSLGVEFSLQVSSPCQKERDIFPHIL